jgi:hypothetical protein
MQGEYIDEREDGLKPSELGRGSKEGTATIEASDARVTAEERLKVYAERGRVKDGRGAAEGEVKCEVV